MTLCSDFDGRYLTEQEKISAVRSKTWGPAKLRAPHLYMCGEHLVDSVQVGVRPRQTPSHRCFAPDTKASLSQLTYLDRNYVLDSCIELRQGQCCQSISCTQPSSLGSSSSPFTRQPELFKLSQLQLVLAGVMSDSTNIPKNANPPFDNHDADIILRSSDLVDFRVYKVILSLVSPFFRSMFTLPGPKSPLSLPRYQANENDHNTIEDRSLKQEIPIIPVAEDSSSLDNLLRTIYPGLEPQARNLDELARVLEILEKYEISTFHAMAQVVIKNMAEANPVQAYAISSRFGLEDGVAVAAQACLRLEFTDILSSPSAHTSHMTISHYQQLLQYHHRCGEVASQALASIEWLKECRERFETLWTCNSCEDRHWLYRRGPLINGLMPHEAIKAPANVWDYVERAQKAFKECPATSVVTEESFILDATEMCNQCKKDRPHTLGLLSQFAAQTVSSALVEVRRFLSYLYALVSFH